MSGDSKRQQRRSLGIHFYEGTNGGGKSFAAVYDTIPTLEMGRPVLSTVRLLDPIRQASCEAESIEAWAEHGVEDHQKFVNPLCLPHPLYVRWTRWHQVLDWEFGDVLADEVQGIISSRGTSVTPGAIVNVLMQLRRLDCFFRATAPAFARMDLAVREVTQGVTNCRGSFFEPIEGRIWPAARLFRWRTFDARDYDEWDANKRDTVPKSLGQWVMRKRHPEVTSYYDTFATVDTIADTSEVGACLRCGGARRRPKCSCDQKAGRTAARQGEDRTRPIETTSDAA